MKLAQFLSLQRLYVDIFVNNLQPVVLLNSSLPSLLYVPDETQFLFVVVSICIVQVSNTNVHVHY